MKKLLLSLLILSSTTLWAEKYALMVGVNNVKGKFHLNVNLDLEMMKILLKKAGFKIQILEGEKASLPEIRKKFKSFYKLKESDTFLFYYTGHGARMRGVNKNEPIDNFFVLHSTDFDENLTIVNSGALTDNEYSMHLHKINAQKVSIIDACHSATIYKGGLSKSEFVKSILAKKGSETIFDRANNIKNFQSFKPNNLINLSAAKDTQQAEISPKGSIFTLVLIELIKKNPNITFKTLEKKIRGLIKPTALRIAKQTGTNLEGKFTPKIYTAPASLKDLRVKDIFAKKKANPSLTSVLEPRESSKPQTRKQLNISTADGKSHYPYGKSIKFNIISKVKKGHLYLFEKKQNTYTLLGERTLSKCQDMGKDKYCKFDNILASKPLGKSIAYVVVTKKPLIIHKEALKKDFEIIEDFFDDEEDLATQIKKDGIAVTSLKLTITK